MSGRKKVHNRSFEKIHVLNLALLGGHRFYRFANQELFDSQWVLGQIQCTAAIFVFKST